MRLIAILGLAATLLAAGCAAGGSEADVEESPRQSAGRPDASAAADKAAPEAAADRALPPQVRVARASNQLGLSLYGRLRQEPGNVFFSPLSISVALGMAYAGARGATAEQMGSVMHLPAAEAARAHEGFGALIGSLLQPREDGPTLRLANRAWVQQGFELREDYLDLVRRHYRAEPGRVDFREAPEQAADTINAWVDEQTAGKIPQLVDAGGFDELTRLILTNAIYLQARWQHEFRPEATEPRPFRAPGGERQVPTMRRQALLPYWEDASLQIVALPYAASGLQMAVLLPRADDGLPALEQGLDEARLREWLSRAEPRPVEVHLPSFTERLRASLADLLRELGMPLAFAPGEADFGGMSREKLSITAVLHEAYVKVDEKGTEAAAATSIEMGVTSVPPGAELEPVVFRADHPFLFLIRDLGSQAVLFMGRIEEPKGEGAAGG